MSHTNQITLSPHITYRFERRDFVAVTRALTHKSLGWRLTMVVAWIALLLMFLFLFASSMERFQRTLSALILDYAPVLLIPVVALLFGHHIWALSAAAVFRNNALANRDVELSFRQSGIEGGSADIRYSIGWEAVNKIIETSTHLFLVLSKREALMVPRRAFESQNDYLAARAFILSQVGPKVTIARH